MIYRSAGSKKRVFISFDYTNDHKYRYLLKALAENPKFDIEFEDWTPSEIDTDRIDRVKAVLTTKIRASTHTLVIIGKDANTPHPDRNKIGERNWQWWEVKKSIAEGKRFVAVKIESTNATPEPLYNQGAKWAMSFNVDSIAKAIDEA